MRDVKREGAGVTKLEKPAMLLLRALLLRCPRCEERKMLRTWFATPDPCRRCALDFNPDGDAAVGWIIVNLGVTELLFFLALKPFSRKRVNQPPLVPKLS